MQEKKELDVLRAHHTLPRSLNAALLPLRLEPTIPDTAPLLQLYEQNASLTQTGACLIIERAFRDMRVRRAAAEKRAFYQPRGIAGDAANKKKPR